MDNEKFKRAYGESRNGCNFFVRHFFVRSFQYSDGVQECAEAGCFWLLDILATEVPQIIRQHKESMLVINVDVAQDGKATITGLGSGDRKIYLRELESADMPPGRWIFFLADEGHRLALILPTEH